MTVRKKVAEKQDDQLTNVLTNALLQASVNYNAAAQTMMKVFIGFCVLTMVWMVAIGVLLMVGVQTTETVETVTSELVQNADNGASNNIEHNITGK